MENPAEEVEQVVYKLTAAANPQVQTVAIEKYFAPDAGFRHPLCTVNAGPNSRKSILGIYRWYRILSPHIKIQVRSVTHNAERNELFLEVVQEFHIRWSPLPPAPARLIVHLVLRPSAEDPKLQVVSLQEDFYHPEDIAALVMPPLIPLVHLALEAGTLASNVHAWLFGLLGY